MRYITRQEAFLFQHQATGPGRLRALVVFLEALPAERLTLGFWFNDGRGCAIGLAAAMEPWFHAQLLRLEDVDQPAFCHPVYQESSDWDAVGRLLRSAHDPERPSRGLHGPISRPTGFLTVDSQVRPHLAYGGLTPEAVLIR